MKDTKAMILDAAERILVERGFAACSLRAVTASAGVNLGAVNYHFKTKESLIQEVIKRQLAPLTVRRLEALDACEGRWAGKPVPLEELLRVFLDPLFSPGCDGTGFLSLLGRIYSDPTIDLAPLLPREFEMTVRRFQRAFRLTLPDLPHDDLFWGMFFTVGAMAQVLAAGPLLELISNGVCDPRDREDAARRLVRFAAAGLRASAGGRGKRKAGGRRAS